jgi:ribonuclease HI
MESVDNTLLVAWHAWYARNEVTHDKPFPSLEGSRRFLCSYHQLIRNSTGVPTDTVIKGKASMYVSGTTSAPILVKRALINPGRGPHWLGQADSWRLIFGGAGLGIVLRNVEGTPIFTSCKFVEDCASPLEAELRACAEGLELALCNSQFPIIVETDCAQLVVAAKSYVQDRSPLLHLVYEIRALANQGTICTFVKVEQTYVRVSHFLANFPRMEHRTTIWLGSWPEEVLQLLQHDQILTPPFE